MLSVVIAITVSITIPWAILPYFSTKLILSARTLLGFLASFLSTIFPWPFLSTAFSWSFITRTFPSTATIRALGPFLPSLHACGAVFMHLRRTRDWLIFHFFISLFLFLLWRLFFLRFFLLLLRLRITRIRAIGI